MELTNGRRYGVDWILAATGVLPNCCGFPGASDEENGIYVNEWLHTSIDNVFAAGDVAHARWEFAPCWFQVSFKVASSHSVNLGNLIIYV